MSVITGTPHPELGVTPGASAEVEVVGGVILAMSIMVGKITITNVGIRGAIASKNRDMVNSYFQYFWPILAIFDDF